MIPTKFNSLNILNQLNERMSITRKILLLVAGVVALFLILNLTVLPFVTQRYFYGFLQQFYADDPEFARGVGETTLYTHTVRRMKWSGLGFVAGVVFLVASLSTSYLVAFGGFLLPRRSGS